jgi:uncharacterized protein (DUF1778 family)
MPRPPKSPADRMDLFVRVRVTKDQRELLEYAADKEERELSDWLRRLAVKEATRIKERETKRAAKTRP